MKGMVMIINVNEVNIKTLEKLAYLLDPFPQKIGKGFNVKCPAHDDTRPSLSLTISDENRLLIYCHAGCSYQEVKRSMREKFGIKLVSRVDLPKGIVKEVKERGRKYYFRNLWAYKDGDGKIIGYVVRYEDDNGDKTIRPYFKRDKNGYWKAGQLEKRPIYNFDLIARDPDARIIFVEGEKCAEATQEMFNEVCNKNDMWIATTICGGSNAFDKADLSALKNREIYILPDADFAGVNLALKLYDKLKENNDVYLVDFNRLFGHEYGSKLDIADWLMATNKYFSPEYFEKAVVNKEDIEWYINHPTIQEERKKIIFDERSRAIYKEKITKEGEVIWEKIENFVLLPKAVLKNVFNGDLEGYKFQILTNNENLSREVLVNKITVSKLENLSLPPEHLRLITSELIRKFQDENIAVEKFANKIGWIDNKTFLHPILIKDIHWGIMGKDVVEKMMQFNSNLNENEARNVITEIFHIIIGSKYPVFTALLFALQTLHNPENKIFFEITGTTSTGKSVLLKTIATLLGWKTKGWNETYNFLIKYISSFENFPVFLDEAHLIKNSGTIVDIIYMLTQGEDKGRLNREGEARKQNVFNTSILSTGEKSIIDAIEQVKDITPYGALARTLTLTVKDIIFTQPICVKLLKLSKKAAGWLLKIWLQEHSKDCYDNIFNADNIDEVQYHALNIFPVLFNILSDLYDMNLINKDDYDKAELDLNIFLEDTKKNFKNEIEIADDEKVREMVEEFLLQHLDKFEDIEGESNFKGDRWGWKDHDGFYILGIPMKNILKELGLPQRFKKEGNMPEWLEKKKKRIPSINSVRRVYFITLKNKIEKDSKVLKFKY